MAGKAPLLLACVLFVVGVVGLAITSAERARWGPFEPRAQAPRTQHVVVFNLPRDMVEPPSLHEFLLPQETALASSPPAHVQAAPEPDATPPPLPALRVYGISADDAGVAAAGTTPTPPPPVRIGNVGTDSEPPPAEETASPEAEVTFGAEEAPEAGE